MGDGQMAVLPDAGQRERLQPLLQDLQQRVEGVRTVVLASVDGFALVSAGADGRGERLAACDQRSVIGQVLWQSRECGQAILAELGGS
ncbi:hypothetical protein [Stenotrophomonas sepilia]|uniref:hypothetical protein n=1 Tax=Stenotrophomonas sepilia TaxID=2860290 RepID=UPI002E79B902|nr:hypothetical protein [Stenotrophomonas sepilia]